MKKLKIAELHDKITLCKVVNSIDSELNRVESIVPYKSVWANVEAKTAVDDNTITGTRPEVRYKITMRKQDADCEYIVYQGKQLLVTTPCYSDILYTYCEATEIVNA